MNEAKPSLLRKSASSGLHSRAQHRSDSTMGDCNRDVRGASAGRRGPDSVCSDREEGDGVAAIRVGTTKKVASELPASL